ncbi:MAG TPA: hypothetical protein VGF55_12720 [Gemmataceae bacterium]
MRDCTFPGRCSPERSTQRFDAGPPSDGRRPTPDDDAAELRARPTDEAVRFRYLAGTWPSAAELRQLRHRHQADPALRRHPLEDVLDQLLDAVTAGGRK